VGITVYDLQGREVHGAGARALGGGAQTLLLETGHLSAGPYIYRVETGGQTVSGRFLLIR